MLRRLALLLSAVLLLTCCAGGYLYVHRASFGLCKPAIIKNPTYNGWPCTVRAPKQAFERVFEDTPRPSYVRATFNDGHLSNLLINGERAPNSVFQDFEEMTRYNIIGFILENRPTVVGSERRVEFVLSTTFD